jgi:hypothetical protein
VEHAGGAYQPGHSQILARCHLNAHVKVTNWEHFLQALTFSLNAAVNSTGRFTHEALLAYDLRIPLWPEVSNSLCRVPTQMPANAATYLNALSQHLQQARTSVRMALPHQQRVLQGRLPPDIKAFKFSATQTNQCGYACCPFHLKT